VSVERIPVLEVGGTHVTAAFVSASEWRVLEGTSLRRPLNADGTAEQILTQMLACANALAASAGQSWGVALPGPFDYARGIGLYQGVAKFEALYGVDVRRALMAGLQPSPGEVVFVNDASAFALGEWVAGAAAGHQRVVGITLGTGIGSAFLSDGKVIAEGPSVPPEGSVYLLTIGGRPLEDTVSRRAILARYRERTARGDPDEVDVREVAERARGGDVVARRVLDEAFTALGTALAPWLERFEASALIVGGSMAGSWDIVPAPLQAGLGNGRRIALRVAAQPGKAALIGAAWHTVAGGSQKHP
jgi:glucokinase